jgi:hypothetical protein
MQFDHPSHGTPCACEVAQKRALWKQRFTHEQLILPYQTVRRQKMLYTEQFCRKAGCTAPAAPVEHRLRRHG